MQEFHARLTATMINKKLENISKQDYVDLFLQYDTNKDDLISKHELLQMMHDSDMKHATLAEAQFVANLIARFKPFINVQTFVNWAESMKYMFQKRLIQYS